MSELKEKKKKEKKEQSYLKTLEINEVGDGKAKAEKRKWRLELRNIKVLKEEVENIAVIIKGCII